MSKNIVFRNHLVGNINDFAEACSMGELSRTSNLVELIMSLSKYHEEGIKLTPSVYLCTDINQVLKLIPDSRSVSIGQTKISENTMREVLKKCAPLAINGWCIYIEGKGKYLQYGLFRDALNPLSVPIDLTLFAPGTEVVKTVKVHKIADDCVEIRNYRGDYHYVFFSNRKDSTPSPLQHVDALVTEICQKVPSEIKESVMTFLGKSLREALLESHGTLIAVLQKKVPKYLSDGVHLPKPIDFSKLVEHALRDKEQLSALAFEVYLLKGMFNSDGIILFSRDAKLLAYNCFISLPAQKTQSHIGGARMRAFEALSIKLGRGISAIYIQSQDGLSDFREVTK